MGDAFACCNDLAMAREGPAETARAACAISSCSNVVVSVDILMDLLFIFALLESDIHLLKAFRAHEEERVE